MKRVWEGGIRLTSSNRGCGGGWRVWEGGIPPRAHPIEGVGEVGGCKDGVGGGYRLSRRWSDCCNGVAVARRALRSYTFLLDDT